jgi:dynactin-6
MATRPPATKRSTTTTTTSSSLPAARPPCNIDPTAVVADKAQITGSHPVTIGPHAVLHPYARIRAEGGSITIGAYCIIAEGAIVGFPEGQAGDVELGRHVSVESGAEVLAKHVGEVTEVGVHTKVGAGATVGKFCRLTPTERVGDGEVLEEFTVVFGEGRRRRDGTVEESEEVRRQRVRVHERHVEVLKKLIPDGKGKWLI